MKIIRYLSDKGGAAWGVLEGRDVLSATGAPFVDLHPGEIVGSVDDIRLLAPVADRPAWAAALMVASPPTQTRCEKSGSHVSAQRRSAARLPNVRRRDSRPR